MTSDEMTELRQLLDSFAINEQAGLWIISRKENDEMLAMVATDGPVDQVRTELRNAGVL